MIDPTSNGRKSTRVSPRSKMTARIGIGLLNLPMFRSGANVQTDHNMRARPRP
jgi:hypothetical protein